MGLLDGALSAVTGGALGSSLLGDLFNVGGEFLGDKIFDWTKTGGSSSTAEGGGSAVDAAYNAMNNVINRGGDITRAGMYNAAGQTGLDVGNTYQLKADQLTNSANAMNAYNRMQSSGDRLLQNANLTGRIAMQNNNRQTGNLRNTVMGQSAAAGMNPAAMASMLKGLNSTMNQGNLQALGQAGEMNAAAIAGAGDMAGKAFSTMASDLALQNELKVKPYEAQINPGVAGLAGSMAGTAAQANLGQSQSEQLAKKDMNVFGSTAGLFGGISQLEMLPYMMQQMGINQPYANYGGGTQTPANNGVMANAPQPRIDPITGAPILFG